MFDMGSKPAENSLASLAGIEKKPEPAADPMDGFGGISIEEEKLPSLGSSGVESGISIAAPVQSSPVQSSPVLSSP